MNLTDINFFKQKIEQLSRVLKGDLTWQKLFSRSYDKNILKVSCAKFFLKSLKRRYHWYHIFKKDVIALLKIHLFLKEGRTGLAEFQKPSPQRVEGNFRIMSCGPPILRQIHYSLSSRKIQCYEEHGHTPQDERYKGLKTSPCEKWAWNRWLESYCLHQQVPLQNRSFTPQEAVASTF